jgi:hypothetical protein
LVYYFCPKPRRWSCGVIWKVDFNQVSVRYTVGSNVYQRWFHVNSDEIAKFNNLNNISSNNGNNNNISSPQSNSQSFNRNSSNSSPNPAAVSRNAQQILPRFA